MCVHAKWLHDHMDCGPPGSSVHGILQARILQWVAMPSSRGSSQPKDWTTSLGSSCIADVFFTAEPLGMPSKRARHLKICFIKEDMTLKNNLKTNPTSSIISEVQMKTITVIIVWIRMAKLKRLTKPVIDKAVVHLEFSYTDGIYKMENIKLYDSGKLFSSFSKV